MLMSKGSASSVTDAFFTGNTRMLRFASGSGTSNCSMITATDCRSFGCPDTITVLLFSSDPTLTRGRGRP